MLIGSFETWALNRTARCSLYCGLLGSRNTVLIGQLSGFGLGPLMKISQPPYALCMLATWLAPSSPPEAQALHAHATYTRAIRSNRFIVSSIATDPSSGSRGYSSWTSR